MLLTTMLVHPCVAISMYRAERSPVGARQGHHHALCRDQALPLTGVHGGDRVGIIPCLYLQQRQRCLPRALARYDLDSTIHVRSSGSLEARGIGRGIDHAGHNRPFPRARSLFT